MDSLWMYENNFFENNFNSNKDFLETDICIVGGGIFGLTCAYYLSNLGYKVTVLDKDKIGKKTTGHTSAKITSQHGLFYTYLTNSYGQKFAKDYLEANENAIKNIKNIIDTEKIKCDFEYQNSYVYATKKEDLNQVKKEISSVENLGYNCEFVTKTGLPFEILGAICFKNQAQFNPLKYLSGLCKCVVSKGGQIFTNATVYDVQKGNDYYVTFAENFKVKSKYVIVASHYPFINFPGFYFAKMYQATSYIIAIDPKKTLFNGMYISANKPSFSFRHTNFNGKEVLLIGGGEHKTGTPPSYKYTYGVLEAEAKKYYPECEVLFRWNTKDCISLDKLPYIGFYSQLMPNMFVRNWF